MSKSKDFVYSLSILLGSIMGAGFFSLPYITSKVGGWVMLGYFLILGGLVALIHLFTAELALRTPDYKRLPGFAKIYLGGWAEKIAFFSIIFGIFGALLVYLIIGGQFLTALLSPVFGGTNLIYTLLYFLAGALLIFFGIKFIAKIELGGLILFFLILMAVFFIGSSRINLANLFPKSDLSQLFLPYGAILFSLWGATIIPEVEEMLKERKKMLKSVIIAGSLIPLFVYVFFIYLVLGLTGMGTSESALTGLVNFLGGGTMRIALLLGILPTFFSFIGLGLTLKKVFNYDLKINKTLAWAVTCFIPLVIFLLGVKDFIPVISLVGAVMIGIDGILILLMYQKIKTGAWRFLTYPLILALAGGIIYEIIYFIK